MARYFLVKIGDIYLTRNGLSNGIRCKTSVTGLDSLVLDKRRNVIKSISGKPYTQYFSGTKGIDIEITIDWLDASVWDDIIASLNEIDEDQTSIQIEMTGEPKNFEFGAVPGNEPTSFDSFTNGLIKGAKIRLVTT